MRGVNKSSGSGLASCVCKFEVRSVHNETPASQLCGAHLHGGGTRRRTTVARAHIRQEEVTNKYYACRERHCPRCQRRASERWCTRQQTSVLRTVTRPRAPICSPWGRSRGTCAAASSAAFAKASRRAASLGSRTPRRPMPCEMR